MAVTTAEGRADAWLGDVCVLGAGTTGLVVAEYLAGLPGSRVRSVTLVGGKSSYESDATRALASRGVRVLCGTERIEGTYDLAVASPGIPEHSEFFQQAREHAAEVVGEPEFAWRESPDRWVAITGTNGKTTTTMLTTALLRAGGLDAEAVGNVGTVVTGEIEKRSADGWFVAELSSFQLQTTRRFHPRVASLINVTPDHLSWHGSMEAYAAAKEKAFANMGDGDLAVVSSEDELCRAVIRRLEDRGLSVCHVSVHGEPAAPLAAFVRAGKLVVRKRDGEHVLVRTDSLAIKGEHNVQNALFAAAMALELGLPDEAVCHGLLSFHPLEHRIELCGELAGVRFVNDSKATNVDAVEKALTAFVPGHVVVLLGGHDKGTTLDTLAHAVSARCKAAVCYGEAGPRIASALRTADDGMGLEVVEAAHMREALEAARGIASAGDVVLLSPACSSFDEFSGFKERGTVFKRLVSELVAEGNEGR